MFNNARYSPAKIKLALNYHLRPLRLLNSRQRNLARHSHPPTKMGTQNRLWCIPLTINSNNPRSTASKDDRNVLRHRLRVMPRPSSHSQGIYSKS